MTEIANPVVLDAAGEYVIVVTGSNGGDPAVTKEYTITLTKLARVDSSDATLSGITLSGTPVEGGSAVPIPLAPALFDKTNHVYIASVDYDDAATVTVTAPATDAPPGSPS